MRKANNSKSSKQKSTDRKLKKIGNFVNSMTTVYNVLYCLRDNIYKHKISWENAIKYDDGYLSPYYKGLLTQIINKTDVILKNLTANGFEVNPNAINEVEELIQNEVVSLAKFDENESDYTRQILSTALKAFFCLGSFKTYYKQYNKMQNITDKLQEIVDVAVNYFNFFERDIQVFVSL